jgi:HemY protein
VIAHEMAHVAYELAPLPWSAKAVLDHRTKNRDWQSALATLEKSISAKLIDKQKGDRQRAVLETAIAEEKALSAPDEALRLTRAALKRAPDLVPALVLCSRLLSRRGDLRKAAKTIEEVWPRLQHPELSAVYIDLRPGDSNADRLLRAEKLARLAPDSTESRMAVASAALAARDFLAARKALRPLIESLEGQGLGPGQSATQPSARVCLLMAELEDAETGAVGEVRQWLARSSNAPRDPTWVADGFMSDRWLPASPVTGALDAFVWQRPAERLAADRDGDKAALTANTPLVIDHPVLPDSADRGHLNGLEPLHGAIQANEITKPNPAVIEALPENVEGLGDAEADKLH